MGWYQKILFLLSFISPVYLFFCVKMFKKVLSLAEKVSMIDLSAALVSREVPSEHHVSSLCAGQQQPCRLAVWPLGRRRTTTTLRRWQTNMTWDRLSSREYISKQLVTHLTVSLWNLQFLLSVPWSKSVHLPAVTYYVLYIFTFIVGMGCKAPMLLYSISAL